MAASVQQRIAFGERTGQKVWRLGSGFGYEGEEPTLTGTRCASMQGCPAVPLEYNHGHGKQTLSMVFYLLNLLAFIAHVILERGDRLYQRCLATTSRRKLWHTFRTTMRMILVTSWTQFLLLYLDEAGPSP